MTKRKSNTPTKSTKHSDDTAKDRAENRKFMLIMAFATLALILLLYFLLVRD
jgi:predicted nucleic acid-binding Zn ribbon protein